MVDNIKFSEPHSQDNLVAMVTVLLELERACSQNRWLAIQNKRRGWGEMGHVTLDWLHGSDHPQLVNAAL